MIRGAPEMGATQGQSTRKSREFKEINKSKSKNKNKNENKNENKKYDTLQHPSPCQPQVPRSGWSISLLSVKGLLQLLATIGR